MPGTRAAGHRFRDTWSWNDAKEEWRDQIANDWPAIGHLVEAAKAHSDGMAGYLAFMAVRVIEMQRILRPDGSLYLHCDPTASNYLRTLLDIVLGARQFRNEIVWQRSAGRAKGSQHAAKTLGTDTDKIMWYSKTGKATFYGVYTPLSDAEIAEQFPLRDSRGLYHTNVPLFCQPSMGPRPNLCYEYNGVRNPYPSGWRVSREKLQEMDERDEIIWREGKRPLRKTYADSYAGKPVGDLWADIPNLTNQLEKTGWATQKPLALLERIIKASSNAGDIVFDPFCGCGTALVAAEQLGRQWVGADDDANAVSVIRERIANLTGTIGDGPQMQHSVSVIMHPPERTASATETVYKDPTGYIVPKMPSDKMSNEAIRQQLIAWQTEQDGLITCPGCGERLRPRHFQCDHINPKSAGGTNRIDNRVMLCGACNGEKGNTRALPALWAAHGVKGKERRRMQGLLAETQSKAQMLVREMDAGGLG